MCARLFSVAYMEMCHYRRVVIILEIDVIKPAQDVGGKIGDPTPYTEGKTSERQFINYAPLAYKGRLINISHT